MEKSTISGPSRPVSFLLDKLPVEIRFQIYDQMINTHHIILITPKSTQRSIFAPFIATCRQLAAEIQKWLAGKNDSSITRSPVFGVFNNQTTTFKMSWVDEDVERKEVPLQQYHFARYQRCYTPLRPGRCIQLLEMWQRAMDCAGSECRREVNHVLKYHAGFESAASHLKGLRDRFLSYGEDDWWVLNAERARVLVRGWELPVELGKFPDQVLWSDDFVTHASHQCYTRQHPMEKGRVRKVRCGLAFEYRFRWLGDVCEFVEVPMLQDQEGPG